MAIAATMKNVSSTTNMTGFLISDFGLKRTTESIRTLLEKADLIPPGVASLLFVGSKSFS
jgi:hypothetical protein